MNNKGFSLIEASIALIIVGLLVTPVIAEYNQQVRQLRSDTTAANNFAVRSAIDAYYLKNKRYPCPAALNKKLGDAGYGNEAAPGTCLPTGLVAGKCVSGVCLADATPPRIGQIVYGGVPFAELQMNETKTYDGWNRKISYAVTLDMADGGAFPAEGSLTLQSFDRNTDALVTKAESGHYIIISHGDNSRGAYTVEGEIGPESFVDTSTGDMLSPCRADEDFDSENCDNDGTFISAKAGGRVVGSDRYFDDTVMDIFTAASNSWNPAATTENITTTLMVGIGTDLVGVQVDPTGTPVPDGSGGFVPYTDVNPGTPIGLDVLRDIRADDAMVQEICDVDGTDCFAADVLAGTGHIDCTLSGGGLSGIANASGQCTDEDFSVGASPATCATGMITGISAGVIQCAP
ncbi:MAG: type II secretion system protein [Micavibrio sp.]